MSHSATPHAHGTDASHTHHVVPFSLLVGIFAALMVLTFATVAATYVDLGSPGNLILCLAIAVIKAALVMLYFMHLRWDSPFNTLIAIAALLFIAIFIVACITDTNQYKGNFLPTNTTSATPAAGAEMPR